MVAVGRVRWENYDTTGKVHCGKIIHSRSEREYDFNGKALWRKDKGRREIKSKE